MNNIIDLFMRYPWDHLDTFVVLIILLEFPLNVLDHDSDHPDDGDDEGAKGQGAEVVAEGPVSLYGSTIDI